MRSADAMRPARRVAHQITRCQHRTFSISASRCYSARGLTARGAADRLMSEFGGKSVTRRQLLDGNQLQKLALTLGRPRIGAVDISEDAPPTGTPVPPGYHLVY